MYLGGQGGQRGYAMAALLVSVAVMAVLMSVAMPVWRHQAQREKESELAFRGEQWVRGIQQYQRRNGPGVFPPSLDVLVQQRLVRKKFKDPITGEDFVPVYAGQQPTQQGQRGGQGQRGAGQGQGGAQPPTGVPGQQGVAAGGIIGVRSKSTDTSIRVYKGATRYDQWQFVGLNIGGPGGPGRGAPGGGGRGPMPGMGGQGPGRGRGPGGGPGGRGPGGPPGRGMQGPGGRGPIVRPPGG
jgi:type II secretory pathway pseudopilin PulG